MASSRDKFWTRPPRPWLGFLKLAEEYGMQWIFSDILSKIQDLNGASFLYANSQTLQANCSLKLPMLSIRRSATTRESFEVVKVSSDTKESDSVYLLPSSMMRPRSNSRYPRLELDRSCPPSVQASSVKYENCDHFSIWCKFKYVAMFVRAFKLIHSLPLYHKLHSRMIFLCR